jgi:alpha-1,3-rhamnosyl/mannosyltransferase
MNHTSQGGKMRVALDVRATLGGAVAGVGRYTVELIRELVALAPPDLDLRLWLAGRRLALLQQALPPELQALQERVPLQMTRLSNALLYRGPALAAWSRLPRWACPPLLPRDLDLYHAPFWPLPRDRKTPQVLTIHDLIAVHHPQWVTGTMKAELAAIRRLAPQAAVVLTDSEATRQDVLSHTRCRPEQVTTVHLGVGEEFLSFADEERLAATRQKYALDRPYIVSLCTREPRKNLGRLIDAYDRLCEGEGPQWDLVLIGAAGWGEDTVAQKISQPRRGRVRVTGYVPREDLPPLLAGAAVMGYVSLYEGFGLPPLEAMATGCPVVVSNVSSLPEVVGEAGIMVDPLECEAIAEGLRQVLTDPARTADLGRRGRERAAQFTWRATAEKTLSAYRQATGVRP